MSRYTRLLALVAVSALTVAACDRVEPPAPAADEPEVVPVTDVGGEPAVPVVEPEPVGVSLAAIADERYIDMWKEPGGDRPALTYDAAHADGRMPPLLVAGEQLDDRGRRWFEVLLPIRPNGRSAWVRERDVRLVERHDRIVIDVSERRLRRFHDGELVSSFLVGVGQDQWPTPIGRFYVWVRVNYGDPNGPYGLFALGLSGFSTVLREWGGSGRVAIHGTPYESNRGQQVSHGCIRVWNPDLRTLRDIPLGTPVIIRP